MGNSNNNANAFASWITPDLANNPQVAADVINQPNPQQTSIAVSTALKTQNSVDSAVLAENATGQRGFWGDVWNYGGSVLNVLNKPLQEVQKDYKFIHSVWTNHGAMEGFIAGLGVVGAGVAGTLTAGPLGGLAAADAAGVAERNLWGRSVSSFKSDVANSENPNYTVSPGRDLANGVGNAFDAIGAKGIGADFKNTEAGYKSIGGLLSGATDALVDFKADPIMIISKFKTAMNDGSLLVKDARSAELASHADLMIKYPLLNQSEGIKNFILASSKTPLNPDHLDLIRGGNTSVSASYNNFLQVAGEKALTDEERNAKAGLLVTKFPTLGSNVIGRLAHVNSIDQAHDVLKTALFLDAQDSNMMTSQIPLITNMRAKFGDATVTQKVADVINKMPATKYASRFSDLGDQTELVKSLQGPDATTVLDRFKSLPGNLYKTATNYMPYSVDAASNKILRDRFAWDNPDAVKVVKQIARQGMSEYAAREWAGKYAEAVVQNDRESARNIKNEAVFQSLIGLGVPKDSNYIKKLYEHAHNLDEVGDSGKVYGTDIDGKPLGQYVDSTGNPKNGALFSRQTSDYFSIPNFLETKALVRQYGKVSKVYSGFDDFLADGFISKIFKPLALSNLGFAERVSGSEIIPAISRFGFTNAAKSAIRGAAASTNSWIAPKEGKHLIANTLQALGLHSGLGGDLSTGFPSFKQAAALGLNKAAAMTGKEQLDFAAKITAANGGSLLTDAVQAGHNNMHDLYDSTRKATHYIQLHRGEKKWDQAPEWTTYERTHNQYLGALHYNIANAAQSIGEKSIANDIYQTMDKFAPHVAKDKGFVTTDANINPFKVDEYDNFRNNLIEQERARLAKGMVQASAKMKSGYALDVQKIGRIKDGDSLQNIATDRVDSVLGKIIGANGKYNSNIAANIARGASTPIEDLHKIYKDDPRNLPRAVEGPVLDHIPAWTNPLSAVIEYGFKKVLDPVVNTLSRKGLYLINAANEYKALGWHVEQGLLQDSEALMLAQQRASVKMLPMIHNVALRSEFAQLARNFIPFYFAQEQAYKRAWWAMKDTSVGLPIISSTLRTYQLEAHALTCTLPTQQDGNGNSYILMPVGGPMGEAAKAVMDFFHVPYVHGLPLSVTGNTTSLRSVMPDANMPGVSPIVSISANFLSDLFPQWRNQAKAVEGGAAYKRGVLDSIFPTTWVKNLWHGLTDNEKDQKLSGAMNLAMASAYMNNQMPPANATPQETQDFINRLQNTAKSALILNGLIGGFSPLAPKTNWAENLRPEFLSLAKKEGLAQGLIDFHKKYGDRSIGFTIGYTENKGAAGAQYPWVQSTIDFVNKNNKLFQTTNNPNTETAAAAFYLIPQGTDKSGNNAMDVFQQLLSAGLRNYRTPEEMYNQLYINAGWNEMSAPLAQHVLNMKEYKDAGDTISSQQESANWKDVMTKMENTNPIWYKNYNNGGAGKINAQQVITQLQYVFAKDVAPKTNQSTLVGALLKDYNMHIGNYAGLTSGPIFDAEKTDWQAYLQTLATQNTSLTNIINSVFMRVD